MEDGEFSIGKVKRITRRFINVKKNVLHFHMTYELICTICIFSKQHFRLPIYVRFNQMLYIYFKIISFSHSLSLSLSLSIYIYIYLSIYVSKYLRVSIDERNFEIHRLVRYKREKEIKKKI